MLLLLPRQQFSCFVQHAGESVSNVMMKAYHLLRFSFPLHMPCALFLHVVSPVFSCNAYAFLFMSLAVDLPHDQLMQK